MSICHNFQINSKLEANMETPGRFLQVQAGSFFLFGPRGTGKSTWLATVQMA
jgi:ABC-type cobalamin transport system ATPase subunit